jgi:predicted nucleic acid-binding protein
MAFKVFLDANVLLDLTLKRSFYDDAKLIMEMAINGKIKAFVTPSIIHSTGYWLTKTYGNKTAEEILLTLLVDIDIIDMPYEVVITSLHSKIDDIEDALQYYAAIHHKLDYFISRDKKFQKESIPTLPVLTPQEFIVHLS